MKSKDITDCGADLQVCGRPLLHREPLNSGQRQDEGVPRRPGGSLRAICLLLAFAATAHAAGTVFSTVLSGNGQDYASAVTSDSFGNTFVAGLTYSPVFPVTANAYQTTLGGTDDAFVAKVGPDGKVIWATYLGGILDDFATGIALDTSGNVWIAGWSRSPNFPVVNPLQALISGTGSDSFDAFVAEFDPTGSKLLYSTFLGGPMNDGAAGIALDSANNVYVVVNSNSETGYPGAPNPLPATGGINVTKLDPQGQLVYTFFRPLDTANAIAVDSAGAAYVAGTSAYLGGFVTSGNQPGTALVFKVSPDGASKVYENDFGGSVATSANAIAVDNAGEAWVGGVTESADFPLVHPYQSTFGSRPIWESTNFGATWTPIDNLPFALPLVMVPDPSTAGTLYQATGDLGVFKSTNGGVNWTQSSSGISGGSVQALAIDPVHTQTLYAATQTAVYKSTDGAASWTTIDTPPIPVTQLAVDAQNPNIIYEVASTVRKSNDDGATWSTVIFPGTPTANAQYFALDPRVSGHLFAATALFYCGAFCGNSQIPELYSSTNGGNTWTLLSTPATGTLGLFVDPSTNPSTVYDGLGYVSADGGVTWTALPTPPFNASNVTALGIDSSGTLYVSVTAKGMYASHNHGQSWTASGSPTPTWSTEAGGPGATAIVPVGSGGTIYDTVDQVGSAGFVTKLSADGSTLEYSTYLNGHTQLEPYFDYAAEPGAVLFENSISGIALDPAGNVVVAGGTRAIDFPAANPAQAANAGLADAFAAVLSPDGSSLRFSTYFGGSQDDAALAVAVDPTGDVILVGQTWSPDFPVPGGSPLPFTYGDAFVVKLQTGPPVISSVLSGASYLPGIEAGSWAMIVGANLANTTRVWTDADFTGDNLPTSLSGVSVTIDGKPAFIYYISPTQINVQVPSDSTLGAVKVQVDDNGVMSAPQQVALLDYAPAFFTDPGTNYAVATSLPNYAVVGTQAAPAQPGDTIVLWATGFGPTTPTAPAGVEVSGAPATSTVPVVMVGGIKANVVSSVLTNGTAGLYQITIQLPANLPTGAQPVQASIGGATTQSGVTLLIG